MTGKHDVACGCLKTRDNIEWNRQADTRRLVDAVSWLFLWSEVLNAPIRHGLSLGNLEPLIYIPKMVMLGMSILLPLHRLRAPAPFLWFGGMVVVSFIWGVADLNNWYQAAFGLWVMVPLLFGLSVGTLVDVMHWRRMFGWLFFVTAVGVFLNVFVVFPWSGQYLKVLGYSVEVARRWTTFGVDRYAGFARASFDAASQLLLFGVFLIVMSRRRIWKIVVWLAAGSGIALTTSKGPFGVWLLLSVYFFGGWVCRWPKYWTEIWLGVLAVILGMMIVLPLSTLWVAYDPNLHGYIMRFIFSSFGQRLDWMWPSSLHLLQEGGGYHWLVGRGVGGIGMAQHYFSPEHYLAGDNLFVYISVEFGVPLGIILLVMFWIRTEDLSLFSDNYKYVLPVIVAIMSYGVVVNVIEGGVLSFFLGLSISSSRQRLA